MTDAIVSPLEMAALGLAAASGLLGLYRLAVGPTSPDRVVAADTLTVITTAGLVWLASIFNKAIYLDVALVYGALAFVGVVAIARAIEPDGEGSDETEGSGK